MEKSKGLIAVQVLGPIHFAWYLLATSLAFIGATGRFADSIAETLQVSKEELLRTVLIETAIFAPLFLLSYTLIYIAIWKRSRAWFMSSAIIFAVVWSGFFLAGWMEDGSSNVVGVFIPIVVLIMLLLPKSREYFDRK